MGSIACGDPLGQLGDGRLHVHDDGLDARRQFGRDALHPRDGLGDRALGAVTRLTCPGVEVPAPAGDAVLEGAGPVGHAVAGRLHALLELPAAHLRLLEPHDAEPDGDVSRVGERLPDVHCD